MDQKSQAYINRWVYVSWVIASLFLIAAVIEFFTKVVAQGSLSSILLCLWGLIVALLSAGGGILYKNDYHDGARVCWAIAGFMSLPFGFVLWAGRKIISDYVKKIEDQEFQQMLDKSKN
jgi:hypothetical protein